MKKIVTAITAAFMVFALAACSNGDDEVVVKTEAGNITKGEFYNEMKKLAGDQVIKQMAYMKILEDKYDVSDKEVQKKLDDLKKQLGITSDQQLQMWMTQQGIENKDQLKEQVRQSLLIFKATTDGVNVSEKEMKDYYNKHKKDQFTKLKVSHILVEKKSEAETIEKKLKNGADFADLAKQHSTDEASAKNGGDVGYITKQSQMVQPFLDAAFQLDVGEISDPVKSQYGYHIIKVTDKKVTSFKDAKDQIKQTLLQQKAKPVSEVFNNLNKEIEAKDEDFKDVFKYEEPQKDQSDDSSSGEDKKQDTDQNKDENSK